MIETPSSQAWFIAGLSRKKLQVTVNIAQEHVRQIPAEAIFHHHAQRCQVLTIGREGVRRHKPSSIAQALGEIKDGKIARVLECEGKNRDITAITDQFKWSHFGNVPGEIERDFLASLLNTCISVSSQAQKVIVLRHNLTSWPGEVNGERRDLISQIIHREDQLFR